MPCSPNRTFSRPEPFCPLPACHVCTAGYRQAGLFAARFSISRQFAGREALWPSAECHTLDSNFNYIRVRSFVLSGAPRRRM
jgi:hypothetical protein